MTTHTHCDDCGKVLDHFRMCPDVSPVRAARGLSNCGRTTPPAVKQHNRRTNEFRPFVQPRKRSFLERILAR